MSKPKDEKISVDPTRNKIFVPGSGELPMIGLDPEQFKNTQATAAAEMHQLETLLASTFFCKHCNNKMEGKVVQVKNNPTSNKPMLACPTCGEMLKLVDSPIVVPASGWKQ